MITKEVNDWIKKVQTGSYFSTEEAMEKFVEIAKYLTKDEIIFYTKKTQWFLEIIIYLSEKSNTTK